MTESPSENETSGNSEKLKVEISISRFGTTLHHAVEYEEWEEPLTNKKTKSSRQKKEVLRPNVSKDTNKDFGLNELQLQYLRAVTRTPGKPCSQYNEYVSCRKEKAIAIRHGLVEEGWLCEEESRTKEMGRTMKRVFPSKKAEELFLNFTGNRKSDGWSSRT